MTWQVPDQQDQQPAQSAPHHPDRSDLASPAWAPPPWGSAPDAPGPASSPRWPIRSIVVIMVLGALVVILTALLLVVVGLAWLGATSRDQPPSAVLGARRVPAVFADGASVGGLGDTARWGDELEVTVTGVRQQPPSPVANIAPGHTLVVVQIQVINLSEDRSFTDSIWETSRYGPAGRDAGRVFDRGISAVLGDLPPGATATGEYGLSVPPDAVGEILFQLHPGFRLAPASWKVGVEEPAEATAAGAAG